MANQKDVRRIAMSLPGTSQRKDRFAFSVRRGDRDKDFIWVWNERIAPRKARVPNPGVLAVRVADLDEKDGLLASDKEKFFTEPHYDGFPAILVRLPAVDTDELKQLIAAAWRCFAPRALLEEFERPQERVRPKRGAGPAGESEAAFARLASTLSKDARVDGPDLPHAKGFGSKGLKVARKMFAFQSKGRLVLKLPAERVEALVAAGTGERFDAGHGRLMKEWLALGYEDPARWMSLAREALEFAAR